MATAKQLAALKKGRAALKKKRAAAKRASTPKKRRTTSKAARKRRPARKSTVKRRATRKRTTRTKKNPVRAFEYLVVLRSPKRKGSTRKSYYLRYRDGRWIFDSLKPIAGWSKTIAEKLAATYGMRALNKMKTKGWGLYLDSKKK